MGRALVPLSMSTVDQIPGRCRNCIAWEVAGAQPEFEIEKNRVFGEEGTQEDGGEEEGAGREGVEQASAERAGAEQAGAEQGQAGRAFEKEVWLSGVMLTWGPAGLIAMVDDKPAGFVLYAPPTAVPAAGRFPTAPVSPDAVLMTGARVLPEFAGQGLGRYLMTGMIAALVRRGVRAIEAFGLDDGHPPVRGLLGRLRRAEPEIGADQLPGCLLPAAFLRSVGFSEVQPHHRFPRLRYELESGINWKAEVEAALEKLFTENVIPSSASPVRELVGAANSALNRLREPAGTRRNSAACPRRDQSDDEAAGQQ